MAGLSGTDTVSRTRLCILNSQSAWTSRTLSGLSRAAHHVRYYAKAACISPLGELRLSIHATESRQLPYRSVREESTRASLLRPWSPT